MDSDGVNLAPHVLIFPVPIQGHVNTMLRLAELLCLSGLDVTFLISEFNHNRLLKHSTVASRFAKYPGFRFQTVSDGLPDDHPRAGEGFVDILPALLRVTAPLFKKMMTETNFFASASQRPVSCIIADGVMNFAIDFAIENGISILYFRTTSSASFWACFRMTELTEAGELPIKGEGMDLPVKSVPAMEDFLRRRDLPGYCRINDLNDITHQILKRETLQTTRAHGLILNTFEDLEGPVLSQIRKHCPRLYAIGPNHYHLQTRMEAKHTETTTSGASASFWEEDRKCLVWLDSQPEKSVIYVSFGSITVVTRDQLLELWYGLVNSGQRFLWVIRPDSIMGKDGKSEIPAELEAGTREKGYMVGWAPQQEVLNHPAVGGFLTHSGWNSTLESIVAGVPMLCWPYFADQFINSRFVSEVWKIGLDMKDTCDRLIVEKMVRDLMDVRREEFLPRIDRMRNLAKKAVSEGGSSYNDFEDLVDFIRSTAV
ncbi:OLC1v1026681C1 [Oldenlandia corymbosa var. corymbosa]|uniref:Glycosyltransferase n=1 Tax=Oldenlandia corymbosa var. corymbosa TaxID=529605 RepID=A0AAV1C7N9_OLDCO|nr:OLC1v1026681C1 [Oldenlandia corymbosa var. corymbosa]